MKNHNHGSTIHDSPAYTHTHCICLSFFLLKILFVFSLISYPKPQLLLGC
uniref:Uncharacterized protein n=1 Tax=Solanum lycopersicum TaxID=4081 RepID=A0A3Q7I4U2_SOLLC